MNTEDGAKLYDVCPHVSDSVRVLRAPWANSQPLSGFPLAHPSECPRTALCWAVHPARTQGPPMPVALSCLIWCHMWVARCCAHVGYGLCSRTPLPHPPQGLFFDDSYGFYPGQVLIGPAKIFSSVQWLSGVKPVLSTKSKFRVVVEEVSTEFEDLPELPAWRWLWSHAG